MIGLNVRRYAFSDANGTTRILPLDCIFELYAYARSQYPGSRLIVSGVTCRIEFPSARSREADLESSPEGGRK